MSKTAYRRAQFAFTISAGAFIAGCCTSASAQSAPAPAAAPATDQASGDIIVTARRREESLQKVPESIQAFSGATLKQYAIQNVSDLAQIAPGLTAEPSVFGKGPLTLSIRGQRQSLANIAYDQPVSVYFNEVVQARTQGLDDAFFDIDSVQVLKGPQGTLFGRNTTGGALLITSKAPTRNFEGYIDATAGNYALARIEGALNVPISSILSIRLAGVITRRDGYLNDPAQGDRVDDAHTNSWRASVRLDPSTTLRNDFVIDGFDENDSGVAYKLTAVNPGSLSASALPDLRYYQTANFWTTNATVPEHGTQIKTLGLSNVTSWDVGGIKLKNIFGFRHVKSDIYFDLDGSSAFIGSSQQDVHEHQYSDEVQALGSTLDHALEYVAGFYWFREKGAEVQTTDILSPTSPNNLITAYDIVNETKAVYAQATYHFGFLQGLSLTAGGRYTWDKRHFDAYSKFTSGVCRLLVSDSGNTPLDPCFRPADASFHKPTYDISLDWQIKPDLLVYVTHRYGYQAGGFTNSAQRPSEFNPYQPQTVQDYEVGVKAQWRLGGAVGQTNVALFRGNYKDIQRLETVYIDVGGLPSPINRVLNAATSTVQGVEVEFRLRPVPALQLTAGYTYLDAHYDNYNVNGVDYSPAPFAGAPKHSFSGSARLHLPVPQTIANTYVQVDGSYMSRTVTQDTTSYDPVSGTVLPTSILPGWGTVNARLDFENVAGKPLKLSVFVRNLASAKYYTTGNDAYASLGDAIRLLGAPRTFGGEVVYRF